jgi:hypothetical protein
LKRLGKNWEASEKLREHKTNRNLRGFCEISSFLELYLEKRNKTPEHVHSSMASSWGIWVIGSILITYIFSFFYFFENSKKNHNYAIRLPAFRLLQFNSPIEFNHFAPLWAVDIQNTWTALGCRSTFYFKIDTIFTKDASLISKTPLFPQLLIRSATRCHFWDQSGITNWYCWDRPFGISILYGNSLKNDSLTTPLQLYSHCQNFRTFKRISLFFIWVLSP